MPDVKERPIIFSADSVRAIIAGQKTQTRRVIRFKRVPPVLFRGPEWWVWPHPNGGWWATTQPPETSIAVPYGTGFPCPFGVPGDRLWVREAWAVAAEFNDRPPSKLPERARDHIWYASDGEKPDWAGRTRARLYMPRWASRILLELTDVRAQHLQDASDVDLLDEGVEFDYVGDDQAQVRRRAYANLWNKLNARIGHDYDWESNPWVWALTFKVLEVRG